MADQRERAVIDLVINGQQAQATGKEITKTYHDARKALASMAETDPGYAKQRKEVELLLKAQQARIVKIHEEKTAWEKFKSGGAGMLTGIVGGNLVTTGISKLMELGPAIVDHQMKIRDSFSDIGKAADLSDQEVGDLNEQLKKINTRTLTQDLRGIAVVGGQFGVAKKDLAGFVESADELNVALGDQFESVEKVAETTLTLRNTFQDIKTDRIDEDMMHIGNGLNYLEAQGAATAPVMADFSSRIGGVAIPLGLTSGQVLGLSATLQELNVTAERGSSAVVDILTGITKAPDTFAKYAKGVDGATLSNKQFKDLVNSDLNGALMAVIRGFQSGDMSATGMAAKLEAMGIKGNGALEIFMKLASNTELLTTRQQQSAEALTNTTSITNEFSKKNHDLAVNLKKLGEWFDGFLENGTLGKFAGLVVYATTKLLGLTDASNQVAKTYVEQRNKAVDLTSKLEPLIKRQDELSKKSKLSQIEQTELKKITAEIASSLPAAATQFDAYGNAIAVSATKARELIAAQKEMASQMKAEALDEQRGQLRSIEWQRKQILEKIKNREEVTVSASGNATARPLSEGDIARLRTDLEKLQSQAFGVLRTMRDLEGGQSIADRRKARRADEPKPETKVDPKFGTEETEAERKAREKKEKAAERASKKALTTAQRQEDSLEKLMADARARTAGAADRDHEKELLEFGEHYHKLYELAGSNKQAQQEITQLMNAELASIEKKNQEREYREAKEHSDKMLRLAIRELEHQKTAKLSDIAGRVAAGGITKEQGKLLEGDVDKAYLDAKELLYSAHYTTLQQKAGDNKKVLEEIETASAEAQDGIEAQRTQSYADHAQARRDIREAELAHELELRQKRMQFAREEKDFRQQQLGEAQALLANDWTQTLKNYKEFWSEATVMQKVAFMASKALALAEIGIQLAKQITLINTTAALVDSVTFGLGGSAIRLKGYAWAIGSAAIQTAAVVAKSPSIPTYEFGGFTNSDEQPSGYTPGPTYYSQGNYIAGEAGQEWIMSAPMLRQPMMANLAGALQALQVSGAWRNLPASSGSSAGDTKSGGANSDALLMMLINEQQQTRAAMAEMAKRPVMLNYKLLKDYEDDITRADIENRL